MFQWSSHSRLRWWTTLILHILSYALVVVTAPLSLFFVLRRIPEYERAVVLGSTLDMVTWVSIYNILNTTFIYRHVFVVLVLSLFCHSLKRFTYKIPE